MGFYIRKSVRVGLVRFNLSGRGLGVSAGIKGFRVGTGPRGTYVHAGRGGLYYRSHFFSTPSVGTRHFPPSTQPSPTPVLHDNLTEIRSAPAERIRDESSDSVLAEIRSRRAAFAITPLASIGFTMLAIAWIVLNWPAWVIVPFIAVPVLLWAHLHDETRRTTVLMYDLESDAIDAYTAFHDAFTKLQKCARVWSVNASGANSDYKYHAGATQLQRRANALLSNASPPGIKTNVPVASIKLGSETLFFFPDRVFVQSASGFGAVSYSQLESRVSTTRFIEDERVPGDARLVGHTWKYLNKNGSPDRRFSHNPQLPILSYGELFMASVSGLRVYLQTSQELAPNAFLNALAGLQTVLASSPERPARLS